MLDTAEHQVTSDDIDDVASVCSSDSGYAESVFTLKSKKPIIIIIINVGDDLSSLKDLDLFEVQETQPNVTPGPANPSPPGLINSKGQKGVSSEVLTVTTIIIMP